MQLGTYSDKFSTEPVGASKYQPKHSGHLANQHSRLTAAGTISPQVLSPSSSELTDQLGTLKRLMSESVRGCCRREAKWQLGIGTACRACRSRRTLAGRAARALRA